MAMYTARLDSSTSWTSASGTGSGSWLGLDFWDRGWGLEAIEPYEDNADPTQDVPPEVVHLRVRFCKVRGSFVMSIHRVIDDPDSARMAVDQSDFSLLVLAVAVHQQQ